VSEFTPAEDGDALSVAEKIGTMPPRLARALLAVSYPLRMAAYITKRP
jgi:hypothetical protein